MKRFVLLFVFLLSFGTVYGKAEFYITDVEPKVVEPQNVYNMTIKIKNLATDYALYLRAILDPEHVSPISVIGSSEKFTRKAKEAKESSLYFGAVLQNEEIVLNYTVYVKEVPEGVYTVPLLLKWKDENMKELSQVLYMGIFVKGSVDIGISGVETSPKEIKAGDDNVKVSVGITNTGDLELRNVEVHALLKNPFKPSFSNSDESYIGTLRKGDLKEAVFYIDVDERAVPKTYTIPLNITFKDSRGNWFSVLKDIKIVVEPKPIFEVLDVEPKTVKAGESVKLIVKIKNVGYEQGENVDVRVIREPTQPFDYEKNSDYIGTLNPGEVGSGVFEFSVDKDAPEKEYRLKINVRCVGDRESGDTNVYTQELQAKINVVSGAEKGSSKGIYVIALIAALIILIIVKRKWF